MNPGNAVMITTKAKEIIWFEKVAERTTFVESPFAAVFWSEESA